LVGVLVWITHPHQVAKEAGAVRVGTASAWAKSLLLVGAAGGVALAWRWARTLSEPEGLAASASVGALLVMSPFLSPQYLLWILPWIAIITAAGERRIGGVALLISLMTVAVFALPLSLRPTQGWVLVRDLILTALVVMVFLRLRAESRSSMSVPISPSSMRQSG